MDEAAIRQHAVELGAELDELNERIEADQERSRALAQILDGYFRLYPDLRDAVIYRRLPDSISRPKGQEAVHQVMASEPDRRWTVEEMVYALDERGWLPDSANPAGAVRTAFERLFKARKASKYVGEGPVAYIYYADPFAKDEGDA